MYFTTYDNITKEIMTIGSCPDRDISYQTIGLANLALVVGQYPPAKYYIANGIPRAKTGYSLIVSKFTISADGIDQSIISNIPINTTITINNSSSVEVNDGIFEITSSEVVALTVVFTNNAYLTSTVTINAI